MISVTKKSILELSQGPKPSCSWNITVYSCSCHISELWLFKVAILSLMLLIFYLIFTCMTLKEASTL